MRDGAVVPLLLSAAGFLYLGTALPVLSVLPADGLLTLMPDVLLTAVPDVLPTLVPDDAVTARPVLVKPFLAPDVRLRAPTVSLLEPRQMSRSEYIGPFPYQGLYQPQ